MPAHRKPTAVLEATGAFARNPARKRAREHEPTPTGPLGEPPAYFDSNHRQAWSELAQIAPEGVLTVSDSLHVEITCRLLVKMRLAPAGIPKWLTKLATVLKTLGWNGREIQEVLDVFRGAIGVSSQELHILEANLAKMGLTPADRSRVVAARSSEEPDDALASALSALRRTDRVQ